MCGRVGIAGTAVTGRAGVGGMPLPLVPTAPSVLGTAPPPRTDAGVRAGADLSSETTVSGRVGIAGLTCFSVAAVSSSTDFDASGALSALKLCKHNMELLDSRFI